MLSWICKLAGNLAGFFQFGLYTHPAVQYRN
jgi:hypothetical protein